MARVPGTDAAVETELRLGQSLVAFGAGAGAIRIRRHAVGRFCDLLRPRYRDQVDRRPHAWLDPKKAKQMGADPQQFMYEATQVLDLCRAVGRLAAHYATEAGRFAIEAADVEKALDMVRPNYPRGAKTLGAYCTDGRRRARKKKN